ncbi:MAG TPA: hypothetical protein VFV01_06935 [Spirillospora sp.]|nr:hypothetical protein [Spirillospora sp.]
MWKAITDEHTLRPDELAVLEEVCFALDELAAMRAQVISDGPVVKGSRGQVREHPLAAGIRAHRALVGRLFRQLGIPDPPDEQAPAPPVAMSARKRRAAESRWRREHGAS